MKYTLYAILFSALVISSSAVRADDAPVDENALFGSDNTVVDNSSFTKKETDEDQNKKHLGVSGEITSVNTQTLTRSMIEDRKNDRDDTFNSRVIGDIFLDARLPSNIKGFGSFEGIYDASRSESTYSMQELFVDFNFARKIYFRTGKQVLQWGRCYLWNPTDLINIEKKTFIDDAGTREGTYGMKAHIPFGTFINIYGFANTFHARNADQIAGAGKFEILVGETEMAVSAWGTRGYHPVGGFDFSTRILTFDIVGEASASRGGNTDRVKIVNNTLTTYREKDKVIPKAAIDIGRSFDIGDEVDKLTVKAEYFYNGDGYTRNDFDGRTYLFDRPVSYTDPQGNVIVQNATAGSAVLYFLGNNLYEPNYYSKHYAALFTSINKFIMSDLTLNINLIGNLAQQSYILSTGLAYQDLNNLKIGFLVNSYLGKKNTEYTYLKNVAQVQLNIGILF